MTPADHGYVKCARCGTWRLESEVVPFDMSGLRWMCVELTWCSQQAAVGKGEMDGGAP